MKAYRREPTLKFRFVKEPTDVEISGEVVHADVGQVLLWDNAYTYVYSVELFRSRYEYVFKDGVTGDCRVKRHIVDVEFLTDNKFVDVSMSELKLVGVAGDALISYGQGMYSAMPQTFFEETYELTQSDEDIVEAFRQVDAGMAHNVHLSHSNVVMISRDHYAALCDLAYGLPKGLTVGSD